MSIHIEHISKHFDRTSVLSDISLDVNTGELVALLGPSGSGKTTLLRIIAGLEFPDEGKGKINFHGSEVTYQSAYDRKAGFVFQHYALFNHLTVAQNIEFGLKVKKRFERLPKIKRKEIVTDLLERIQLPEYSGRYPNQLSGGQRQRVALARALAVNPQVLLLDEPFGALDAKVRKELRRWLREFHDNIKLTTLFVTHDQDEAFELADRVVVLGQGEIQQVGTPDQLRDKPVNQFVSDFIEA
ncbi:sulfate ABC transporter ATP-binding protein [Phragmitibacter flavus]|uniref:Sulfate ABC transporter ATP-binding protein n=1 Tax=Phragmitibacter flavus TaxID=2576071 RepID=A0A5R8KIC8_9BACT|nr:sulfate ABC transporter ATP-binding protein [Phragmitibacter flavus]TLD72068.1 sulfate ABC transporter ATP-binding protein [Phragmitibacter flavus]